MRKRTLNKSIRDEKGQALILVLILMLVGGLIIAPLLAYMSTGIKVGKEVFEERMYGQYAADSGVEDALYRIKRDDPALPEEWQGVWNKDAYDTPFTYSIPQLNGNDVGVTIQPQWALEGLEAPPLGMTPHADIVIVGDTIGTAGDNGLYQISINYDLSIGELKIHRVGAWLPGGFSYMPGMSNLEAAPGADYYCVPEVNLYRGGEVITWNFSPPYPSFEDLPGSGTKRIVTFEFTPKGTPVSAFSWVVSKRNDIYLSWDVDIKTYQITSQAEDVDSGKSIGVEAYAVKNEMRELGSTISGDYRAIGATLMIEGSGHGYNPDGIRYELLNESDATVSDIPDNAQVEAAYLYWSAWLASSSAEQILFLDDCSNFNNWIPDADWELYPLRSPWEFRGHHSGSESNRYLTMSDSIDLSSCSPGAAIVSWKQDEGGSLEGTDRLYFAFSKDGGINWGDDIEAFRNDNPPSSFSHTIPDEYLTENFRMRFYLYGFSGTGEYAYIDKIKISVSLETIADTSAIFKINNTQVYFDGGGEPTVGNEEITASEWSILENQPGEYSYACYLDVTELVKEYSNTGGGENHTGNGTYTVGDVYGDTDNEWSYAAWSLIIIYSSPETKGHQLYLYDDFTYVDNDETLEFPISGFLVPEPIEGEENAAKLTCFVGEGDDCYNGDYLKFNGTALSDGKSTSNVWNSWSYGLAQDGIDIDTFDVTWSSGLLEPGDTSAQVTMPTQTDSWNLVYIILSFRSEITTSGTITYLYIGGG